MQGHRKLMTICCAAVLTLGLAACGGGDDDNTAQAPVTMPEPMPAPDPGPTDLEETQTAAAELATAAMTASTNAAASASSAEEATATLATLQTGGTAMASAMAAQMAAEDAAKAASDAAAASTAAAAATTGDAAESAWADARAAKEAADAAEAEAMEHAMAAIEAAMTELHIDGTMKSVGESSVDADAGTLTSQTDGTMTGFIGSVSRDVVAVDGVAFDQRGTQATDPADDTNNATDVAYVQAVATGSASIGKMLDTSDDMARLTIITAREGKRNVRVFADRAADTSADGLLTSAGELVADIDTGTEGNQVASVKSIGNFYMATPPATDTANALDAMDVVNPGSDPVELFELSGTVTGGTAPTTVYARVVSTTTTNTADGTTTTTRVYQAVDITAFAALDSPADGDNNPEQVQVTAAIPTAVDYDHIHFGVWAGLRGNEDGDNSVIADLGIGFVQNHDGSGVTTGHVTGTATYSGDWVAVVRPMHSTALSVEDGHAALTANFSTDEFTGTLTGLATLEGSLSGNTFSGTDATVSHEDMDASGTFAGSFSGALYGPDGAEAAGVFSFDGGEAGAFVGAFGGRDDNQ